ncbi:MAG TPA: hypothetical protein VI248_03720 [Kineosporiaceae bacterium]
MDLRSIYVLSVQRDKLRNDPLTDRRRLIDIDRRIKDLLGDDA